VTPSKATGKNRAAGSCNVTKTKKEVRSSSSANSQSADKTSSKKAKGRRPMNCYAAFVKAQLANRKISKVRSRDLTTVISR